MNGPRLEFLKSRRCIGLILGLVLLCPLTLTAADKLYELRIYTTNPGKLDALNNRFRDHTLKLFEQHGIESLYYWNVTEGAEGEDPANMLVYIVAHKDKAAADAAWQAFLADPEWQKVASESEAGGAILAGRPVSIYMESVDIPTGENAPAGSDANRIFELRKYNTGADGLAGTIDRFKAGEAELFRKHGMQTLHFWSALDKSSFIYLLAHKDRDTSKESWQGFFAEFRPFFEKYNAGRPAPPAGTPPPPRMTSEIRFLTPTDYSPGK